MPLALYVYTRARVKIPPLVMTRADIEPLEWARRPPLASSLGLIGVIISHAAPKTCSIIAFFGRYMHDNLYQKLSVTIGTKRAA